MPTVAQLQQQPQFLSLLRFLLLLFKIAPSSVMVEQPRLPFPVAAALLLTAALATSPAAPVLTALPLQILTAARLLLQLLLQNLLNYLQPARPYPTYLATEAPTVR